MNAESSPQRLSLGAAVGAALGLVVWLAYGVAHADAFAPAYAAAFVLGAAGVCAVARLLVGRSLGAVVGLALGFALGVGVGGQPRAGASLEGGELVLSGTTTDGKPFDLARMRGKVVLIDLWSVSCAPCLAAMPRLRSLSDELSRDGLELVGVNLDPDRAAVDRYLANNSYPWPQLSRHGQTDPSLKAMLDRLGAAMLPFVVLVDRDGRVAFAGVPEADFPSQVRRLVGREDLSRAPPPPVVPHFAWGFALFGAAVAAALQRGAEAGAGT